MPRSGLETPGVGEPARPSPRTSAAGGAGSRPSPSSAWRTPAGSSARQCRLRTLQSSPPEPPQSRQARAPADASRDRASRKSTSAPCGERCGCNRLRLGLCCWAGPGWANPEPRKGGKHLHAPNLLRRRRAAESPGLRPQRAELAAGEARQRRGGHRRWRPRRQRCNEVHRLLRLRVAKPWSARMTSIKRHKGQTLHREIRRGRLERRRFSIFVLDNDIPRPRPGPGRRKPHLCEHPKQERSSSE